MKNILNSILGMAAAAVLAVSCNVEAVTATFDPATVDGNGVSFLQSIASDLEIPAATSEYNLVVSRSKATDVQIVNLTSTLPASIVCPSAVSFAAGEYETILKLDISKMEVGSTMKGTISIEGLTDSEKNFCQSSISCTFAKAYTWVSIGKGQFLDVFWEGELFDAEVMKAEGFDLYRFMNPYKESVGTGPKPDYVAVTVNPDGTAKFDTFNTPYMYDDSHCVTAYFPSEASSSAASYDASNVFLDKYYFAFMPYWYVNGVGGWGCNYGYTLFASLPGAPQDLGDWYNENFGE